VALEAEIEKAITTGPATLDNLRAVLVSVDGETRIAHYRHGFTADDHGHVFSVTKSVVSILIGIAIGDGLIAGLDEPLGELLPEHRQAMSGDTADVTLRQLMTMSGGFDDYMPVGDQWEGTAPHDPRLRPEKLFDPLGIRPARRSPGRSRICSRRSSPRPGSGGEPTPTASGSARPVYG